MRRFSIYIIVICVVLAGKLHSQQSKVDEARVNFISQKLQLSPSESKNFWPVYNEYLDKMKSVRKERKKIFVSYNYAQSPADAELFITKHIQLDNLENQIKAEYIQKFRQILGPVKTAFLLKAEEEFRLELVKILKTDKTD